MAQHKPNYFPFPLLALVGALLVLAQAACTYTQKITDGPTAYELKRYHEAAPLLEKEIAKTKSRVERGKLAFMLGESYSAMHRPDDALPWYRKAYDFQYGPAALEAYAEGLMETEQYKEALEAYKELGFEIGSRYQYRRQMQAAQAGLDWDESKARWEVKEAPFETGGAAYAPIYAGADKLLYTVDKPLSVEDDRVYAWTGRSFSDIVAQSLSPDAEPQPLDEMINGQYNEGAAAMSPDGRHLAFTRCAPFGYETGYCRVFVADREGDSWSEPQPLAFQEEEVNYMQPAWSTDGNFLYFSSDHPDGIGGYDIYFSERMPPHDWSAPQRLPRAINSPEDEHFPRWRGDTLFFSSDGHAGLGGLDIFRVHRMGSDVWSTPQNLMPPLNSGGDDIGITYDASDPNKSRGYFSSNRGDGLDRIFSFEMLPPPPPPPAPPVEDSIEVEEKEAIWTLNVYVVEELRRDPTNPNSPVLGKAPLESATLSVEPASLSSDLRLVEPGHWALELEPDRKYRFLANADGYLNQDGSFSSAGMTKAPGDADQSFELEIELDKIYAGREIVLDDIYYDFDKSDIRADAEPTLRKLARDLQLNPDLRIRLGSHTDCQGGDGYNQALSQRRAESAVNFLIEQGIAPGRLEAVGYGEDVPRTDCACSRCTDDEHQLNRRTTFAVLEGESGGF